MKTARLDKSHTPVVQEPHVSPLSQISFSPILRQAELREHREKVDLFMAVWTMAQDHPQMSAGEALKRWESDYGG